MTTEVFRRDGHVLDLALDRRAAGELSPAQLAALEAHLAACAPCQARADEAADVLAVAPPAWTPQAEVIAFPGPRAAPTAQEGGGGAVIGLPTARRPLTRAAPWLGGLAAAAAVVLALRPPAPAPDRPEAFQARGSALELQVFRQAASTDAAPGVSQALVDGDHVRPGDTLGFRVRTRDGGHVMLVGVDGAGQVYPVFPGDPRSAPPRFAGDEEAHTLDAALRLDATPGAERLVLLRCADPVALADVADALRAAASEPVLPPLRAGCEQRAARFPKDVP